MNESQPTAAHRFAETILGLNWTSPLARNQSQRPSDVPVSAGAILAARPRTARVMADATAASPLSSSGIANETRSDAIVRRAALSIASSERPRTVRNFGQR